MSKTHSEPSVQWGAMRAVPPRSGTRQGCPLSPLLLNTVPGILATASRPDRVIRSTGVGNEDVKLPLATNDMILYAENSKSSTRATTQVCCGLKLSLVPPKPIC